jgi:serine/threonine protein kinase
MPDPSALLSGRYRYKSRLEAGTKAPTWLATDEQTGTDVVASALPSARVAALLGVVGLKHPNLAGIVEVVDSPDPTALPEGAPPGGAVVVAEHITGKTLHQALKSARITPAEAVTLWIRLAQGVAALHASGGAHGAISPRSIVMDPPGNRSGPILTQLLAPTSGAYCAPERLQGRGPSSADDTWALHAVLFSSLTGSPPFRGDTKDQLLKSIASGQLQRLKDFGINDEGLNEIFSVGLVANTARRHAAATELVEALERWEPRSEAASEWEDIATVVASSTEDMAAAMRHEPPPAPMLSIPPVPVEPEPEPEPPPAPPREPEPAPEPAAPAADASGSDAPSPYDDEDDQTTVMGGGPIEDIRSALAKYSDAPPLDLPVVPPKERPQQPPPQLPGSPFDPTPPPPAPMPGAPHHQPVMPSPGFPHPGSAFPPPISAFPPSIPGPAPTGIELPPGALDDMAQLRRASLGPKLVLLGIAVLVAIGVGVLLYLNSRGIITRAPPAGPGREPARVASAPPVPVPVPSESADRTAPAPSAAKPTADVAPHERASCVASHFEGETLKGDEDFSFLCDDKDFRGINSQVHRRLVVGGAGKVTPGMREWSAFGWYELAASAVIRAACCPRSTPGPSLPETAGDCEQLGRALTELAKPPLRPGSVEARAGGYEAAVLCLFKKGIPRPYNYMQRPTRHARDVFVAFMTRAATRAPT